MNGKIPVGILGATGMVGQQFVKFLQNHPWFEIDLAGRERPLGRQALSRSHQLATGWRDARERATIPVEECKPGNAPRLVFSAMDASVATEIEQDFRAGRPRGRLQFAQPSHGAGCSAADSRNESGSSEDHSATSSAGAAGRGRSRPIRIAPRWCWPWRSRR